MTLILHSTSNAKLKLLAKVAEEMGVEVQQSPVKQSLEKRMAIPGNTFDGEELDAWVTKSAGEKGIPLEKASQRFDNLKQK